MGGGGSSTHDPVSTRGRHASIQEVAEEDENYDDMDTLVISADEEGGGEGGVANEDDSERENILKRHQKQTWAVIYDGWLSRECLSELLQGQRIFIAMFLFTD